MSIPIFEVTGKVLFSSGIELVRHVVKHILYKRKERWAQLFDGNLIYGALQEVGNNLNADDRESIRTLFVLPPKAKPADWLEEALSQLGQKASLKGISRKYYKTVRDLVLRLSREGEGHQHWYQEKMPDSNLTAILKRLHELKHEPYSFPNSACHMIKFYDKKTGIFIVVKNFIKNGRLTGFSIRTAYRPCPKVHCSAKEYFQKESAKAVFQKECERKCLRRRKRKTRAPSSESVKEVFVVYGYLCAEHYNKEKHH